MAAIRILVTGADGFLGRHVVVAVREAGHTALATARESGDAALDLGAPGMVAAVLQALQPDLVLHLCAMSRIADCERDPAAAEHTNTWLAGQWAERFGARMLFTSTDLVFDGRGGPYDEDAVPAPLSVYGASKAAGEELVRDRGGRVVRLPLLFGPDARGRGASEAVRRAVTSSQSSTWYTNEYRTPLHVRDAARALVAAVVEPEGPNLFHLPGPERLSRWQFAQRLCAVHGLSTERLRPVECRDGSRPRDVSLRGAFGAERSLEEMLLDC